MTKHRTVLGIWLCAALLVASEPRAQSRARPAVAAASAHAGIEAELHGSAIALAGRPYVLRGVAYAVTELATLRTLPRASVTAWIEERESRRAAAHETTVADGEGNFQLAIATPTSGDLDAMLHVEVGDGSNVRRFERLIQLRAPQVLDLLTDRILYEPGETMHVWVRLRERDSLVPVASRRVHLRVTSGAERVTVLADMRANTSAMGALSFDVPVDAESGERSLGVSVATDDGARIEGSTQVRVGQRTIERMMARVVLAHDVVAPGEPVHATVTVRAASGAPVRGATVEVTRRRVGLSRTTGPDGRAEFTWTAPVFAERGVDTESIDVRAVHPGVGSAHTSASYQIAAVPFQLSLTAGHDGVVLDVDSPAYVSVTDPRGLPAPAGTRVRASGIIVARGRFEGVTDAHGLVTVPIHATRDAVAEHGGGDCSGRVAGTLDIEILGHDALASRLCVPVAANAQVRVEALSPVVAPGGDVRVRFTRRAAVRGRSVVLDLLRSDGRYSFATVIATARVPPERTDATLRMPSNVVGVVHVRARAVLADETAEGAGSRDAVLSRPAHAFDLRLTTERAVYHPRETARVFADAPAGTPRGAIALVVRDLAAHGGEVPFARAWLDNALSRAVISPATPDADRLVRAALAAGLGQDAAPERAAPLEGPGEAVGVYSESFEPRGDLRDPFGRRQEFLRRGLVPVFGALENAIDETAAGNIDGVVIGRGARTAFAPDAIHALVEHGSLMAPQARTLGDTLLSVTALERAGLGFDFAHAARRVARVRLVRLLAALLQPVDPGGDTPSPLAADPPERWLSRLVGLGRITPGALRDPWGGTFALRRTVGRAPAVSLGVRAVGWELSSPGPDGVPGNGDDVRDPFARVLPAGTPYAIGIGEDALMVALAALDPATAAITAMVAAYRRVGSGAHEEEIGDIVTASDSAGEAFGAAGLGLGNIGTMGHGSGSGSGSGYGSGGGRGGRTGMLGQLASLVRERFPATLMFVAERALDPSGRTVFDVTLADALTTFRIEAIAWTAEGWTSSAAVDVRCDQDVVIDAPIPEYAAPGDVLRIPVRLANRGESAVRARPVVALEGGLDVRVDPADEVSIPAGDAIEAIVTLRVGRAAAGTVRVTAVNPVTGAMLDAVRRPLRVIDDARPERVTTEALVDADGELRLAIPRDATPSGDAIVRLTVGTALDVSPSAWVVRDGDATWALWAHAMSGTTPASDPHRALDRIRRGSRDASITASQRARALSRAWASADTDDQALSERLEALTRTLDASHEDAVESLVSLIPAIARIELHAAEREGLTRVADRLRRAVERDTARLGDEPGQYALAAWALRATGHGASTRADEFLRRALRAVRTEGDTSVLDAPDGSIDGRVADSCTLALALIAGGDRVGAFRFVRGLLGRDVFGQVRDVRARALRHALLAKLTTGADALEGSHATITIDGTAHDVIVRDGAAHLASDALGRPGAHRVSVHLARPAVLRATTTVRYGRPWSSALVATAPLELTLDGRTGARDTRAAFVLRVRNRGPRVLAHMVVRVNLPAGGELDAITRRDLTTRLAAAPAIDDRTLTLYLRTLAPGGAARIPLRIRWSVGGTLHGLGVVARVDDTPDAPAAVLAPRAVTLEDRGAEPEMEAAR